jgi:hypothetical protein
MEIRLFIYETQYVAAAEVFLQTVYKKTGLVALKSRKA